MSGRVRGLCEALLLLAAAIGLTSTLGGCAEDPTDPGVRPPKGHVDLREEGDPSLSPATCEPPPVLVRGVVRCQDQAPECWTLAPDSQESGLHCIPGAPDSYPCFCVGSEGPDVWCDRGLH